jgi:hypothetical protein
MSRSKPVSRSEQVRREQRAERIARSLGFVGHVEYRHVYSRSGGAQFVLGASSTTDLLIVYAEAFERDAGADDFSLEAMIAHERGHQLMARNQRLLRNVPNEWSESAEEVVASLLGSLLVESPKDQQDLLLKALFEVTEHGLGAERATTIVTRLRVLLEKFI